MKTLFFSSLLAVAVMAFFVAIVNLFGFEGLFNIVFVSFVVGVIVEMIYSHIDDKKAAKAYIKRQGRGKIKVIDGEFYSK